MKLFGISLGKEKAVTFNEFRDQVRLAVRRAHPGARIEAKDDGFVLYREGEAPVVGNIKQLYHNYFKNPGDRDALIGGWIASLTFETPQHSWMEAANTLRPTLKNTTFVDAANKSLGKQEDSLPSQPFLGDLHVIVMRDLPGTAVAVTQKMMDDWGVTLPQCVTEAMSNLGVQSFPDVSNAMTTGGGKKGMMGEEVGLDFKGDHLTATWLISERFRDFVGQRLQGDYIVAVPNRGRLTAVRADEPGLIASIQQTARNYGSQPYPLTGLLFHVSAATTGGQVTVFQPGVTGAAPATLEAGSQFAAGKTPSGPPSVGNIAAGMAPLPAAQPKSLNEWYGLSESTLDEPEPTNTPPTVKTARKK